MTARKFCGAALLLALFLFAPLSFAFQHAKDWQQTVLIVLSYIGAMAFLLGVLYTAISLLFPKES